MEHSGKLFKKYIYIYEGRRDWGASRRYTLQQMVSVPCVRAMTEIKLQPRRESKISFLPPFLFKTNYYYVYIFFPSLFCLNSPVFPACFDLLFLSFFSLAGNNAPTTATIASSSTISTQEENASQSELYVRIQNSLLNKLFRSNGEHFFSLSAPIDNRSVQSKSAEKLLFFCHRIRHF